MDFAAYHAQGLCAWVYIVQPRLDRLDVSAEFLVDAVVGLGHCLVGVLNAAPAGDPGPQTSAALPPVVKAGSIARHFRLEGIGLGQDDVLRFACQPLVLFLHFESL